MTLSMSLNKPNVAAPMPTQKNVKCTFTVTDKIFVDTSGTDYTLVDTYTKSSSALKWQPRITEILALCPTASASRTLTDGTDTAVIANSGTVTLSQTVTATVTRTVRVAFSDPTSMMSLAIYPKFDRSAIQSLILTATIGPLFGYAKLYTSGGLLKSQKYVGVGFPVVFNFTELEAAGANGYVDITVDLHAITSASTYRLNNIGSLVIDAEFYNNATDLISQLALATAGSAVSNIVSLYATGPINNLGLVQSIKNMIGNLLSPSVAQFLVSAVGVTIQQLATAFALGVLMAADNGISISVDYLQQKMANFMNVILRVAQNGVAAAGLVTGAIGNMLLASGKKDTVGTAVSMIGSVLATATMLSYTSGVIEYLGF